MSSGDHVDSPPFPTIEAAYRWLDGHINYERRLGELAYDRRTFEIEGFREQLSRLGNPQRACRTIHIAGTRGKGSSALLLEAVLRGLGLRVATFTSPHLREYRERIRIDGESIAAEGFRRHLEAAAAARAPGGEEASFKTVFEYLTAVFFLAAREARVDWMIVETGLGGRLDCTNVLDAGPVLLTRIGLEHTQLLGTTHRAIAGEKAAILKTGGWGVFTRQANDGEAEGVFKARAEETGAPLFVADSLCPLKEAEFSPRGMDLVYGFEGADLDFSLPLHGPFLAENLQGGLAMLAVLRKRGELPRFDPAALGSFLSNVRLPGRMERVAGNTEDQFDVILDGAHCPTGARALAEGMAAHFGNAPAVAVIGMMADKDHSGFFRNLAAGGADWKKVICYPVGSPRGAGEEALAEAARPFFREVGSSPSLKTALQSARKAAEKGYRIVVSGSIYGLASASDWMNQRHAGKSASAPSEAQAHPPSDSGNPGAQL